VIIRQSLGKVSKRLQVVDGAELVHMRQHGPNAARPCLETSDAQTRV
jgi:hypothetical protein